MLERLTLLLAMILSFTPLSACDKPEEFFPTGRWEVLQREDVYENNDHPLKVAFVLEKGEICSISPKVLIRKDMGYRQVSCPKGSGWIYSSLYFKKISD